jgi:hypothetical protein
LLTLDDIHYMLGRIDGKVTMLIEQGKIQDARHTGLEGRVRLLEGDATSNLEPRVRKLENRQYWYSGAAAMLGAAVSYVAKSATGHP